MENLGENILANVIAGLIIAVFITGVSLLFGSVRHRLKEIFFGPRLIVHVWTEVAINGKLRRRFRWPSVVVGLGRDPVYRGDLEPRLASRLKYWNTPWQSKRRFLVNPMYPLGDKVAGADSLVGMHVVVRNSGRRILVPEDVGTISLRLDVPSLHLMDWSTGAFDEPGWERSLSPLLAGKAEWDEDLSWWNLEGKRQIPDDAPTTIGLKLKSGLRPREAVRDVLAVLVDSRDAGLHDLDYSVVSAEQELPLLVKPWRPALPGERIRHPFRTLWRRLVLTSRLPPAD